VYAGASASDFREYAVEEVAKKALSFDAGHVIITGGEPLLYRREIKRLCHILKREGRTTAIETNATLYAGGLKADLISLSPKLPSAGQKEAIKMNVIRQFLKNYRCELKFVIDNKRDLAACVDILSRLKRYNFEGPILQPNGLVGSAAEYRKRLAKLAQIVCIEENRYSEFFRRYKETRVLPQLHRVAFGAKRGV